MSNHAAEALQIRGPAFPSRSAKDVVCQASKLPVEQASLLDCHSAVVHGEDKNLPGGGDCFGASGASASSVIFDESVVGVGIQNTIPFDNSSEQRTKSGRIVKPMKRSQFLKKALIVSAPIVKPKIRDQSVKTIGKKSATLQPLLDESRSVAEQHMEDSPGSSNVGGSSVQPHDSISQVGVKPFTSTAFDSLSPSRKPWRAGKHPYNHKQLNSHGRADAVAAGSVKQQQAAEDAVRRASLLISQSAKKKKKQNSQCMVRDLKYLLSATSSNGVCCETRLRSADESSQVSRSKAASVILPPSNAPLALAQTTSKDNRALALQKKSLAERATKSTNRFAATHSSRSAACSTSAAICSDKPRAKKKETAAMERRKVGRPRKSVLAVVESVALGRFKKIASKSVDRTVTAYPPPAVASNVSLGARKARVSRSVRAKQQFNADRQQLPEDSIAHACVTTATISRQLSNQRKGKANNVPKLAKRKATSQPCQVAQLPVVGGIAVARGNVIEQPGRAPMPKVVAKGGRPTKEPKQAQQKKAAKDEDGASKARATKTALHTRRTKQNAAVNAVSSAENAPIANAGSVRFISTSSMVLRTRTAVVAAALPSQNRKRTSVGQDVGEPKKKASKRTLTEERSLTVVDVVKDQLTKVVRKRGRRKGNANSVDTAKSDLKKSLDLCSKPRPTSIVKSFAAPNTVDHAIPKQKDKPVQSGVGLTAGKGTLKRRKQAREVASKAMLKATLPSGDEAMNDSGDDEYFASIQHTRKPLPSLLTTSMLRGDMSLLSAYSPGMTSVGTPGRWDIDLASMPRTPADSAVSTPGTSHDIRNVDRYLHRFQKEKTQRSRQPSLPSACGEPKKSVRTRKQKQVLPAEAISQAERFKLFSKDVAVTTKHSDSQESDDDSYFSE